MNERDINNIIDELDQQEVVVFQVSGKGVYYAICEWSGFDMSWWKHTVNLYQKCGSEEKAVAMCHDLNSRVSNAPTSAKEAVLADDAWWK